MRPAVPDLTAGEVLVHRTGLHPIVYVSPAATILAGFVLGFAVNTSIGALLLGLGVMGLIGAAARQWAGAFIVTNRRVIAQTGLFSRRTSIIDIATLESVTVTQDVFARRFNYGAIALIGAGGVQEKFTPIADPLAFRHAVEAQQI